VPDGYLNELLSRTGRPQPNWWFSATDMRDEGSAYLYEFGVHAMKRMYSFFLRDAESAARVASRSQIPLHGLADGYILNLDLVAKFN
jgi:hypothetical protein